MDHVGKRRASEKEPSSGNDGTGLDDEKDYIAEEEKETEGENTPSVRVKGIPEFAELRKPTFTERVALAWSTLRGTATQLPNRDELIRERYKKKTARQNHYGICLMITLIVQLVAINAFMWWLLRKNDWQVDSSIIIAFLTSVVAEVIGLVYAVVKATFDRDEEV